MRAVCISDTHGRHLSLKVPSGDLLIHAGDMTRRGTLREVQEFLEWFSNQRFKHKILIAGNHDFFFEHAKGEQIANLIPSNVTYLNDSGIQIHGLNFWGSPVTPWFHDWAFNRKRGEEIKKHWDLIPLNTDVLITHGPPFGVLDQTVYGLKVGCEELQAKIENIKPRFHFFGHIHESYGQYSAQGTQFINASVLNEHYTLSNPPFLLQLTD
ncbi:MAG: metallophosphatase domain-containing protein [Sphingobacterium sp.]